MKENMIPSREDMYSRSKGILEVDILRDKRVCIVGLGSFGSHIALELTKAGVGEFDLFDFDRIEIHNLIRHIATVKDLGELKTDVMEEAIKGKNPYAVVHKHNMDIVQDVNLFTQVADECDILICATDNNRSRFLMSQVANDKNIVCIYGRAITRAIGGDVFIQRPSGACYSCLIGNAWFNSRDEEISNEKSARREGIIPAYTSADDADAMVQVGLSSDIMPICNMMVKLALVELSRSRESGISELEKELVYNYYMWANRREGRHSNWAPFDDAGNKPTILRWYGAYIAKNDHCVICGDCGIDDEVNEK